MNARRVSRAWNSLFTNEDFCLAVVRLCFRCKWVNDFEPLNSERKVAVKTSLSKWLTGQAIDRVRSFHGHYDSMEVYWYQGSSEDLPDRVMPNGPTDHQYCNGRVAFKLHSRVVVVRDLRKLNSLSLGSLNGEYHFCDVNREPIDKFLLSDEWLLGQKSNP